MSVTSATSGGRHPGIESVVQVISYPYSSLISLHTYEADITDGSG